MAGLKTTINRGNNVFCPVICNGGYKLDGRMCFASNSYHEAATASGEPYKLEFSLDIASDTELSDPHVDGDEAFDPGDLYLWKSGPVSPPGRDGIKDDTIFEGGDPSPDPPDFSGGTSVPVGEGDASLYTEYLDIDGHDQIKVSLVELIPGGALSEPIAQFGSKGIFDAK